MDTAEVLKIVEGLSKRELYYWEEIRLIRPEKIRRGKVEFREYSKKDLEKIQKIYHYVKQGFTPKVAYERAFPVSGADSQSDYIIKWDDLSVEYRDMLVVTAQPDFSDTDDPSNSTPDRKNSGSEPVVNLKWHSGSVKKISNRAFEYLQNETFDFIFPMDDFSLIVLGGLSILWEERLGKRLLFDPPDELESFIEGQNKIVLLNKGFCHLNFSMTFDIDLAGALFHGGQEFEKLGGKVVKALLIFANSKFEKEYFNLNFDVDFLLDEDELESAFNSYKNNAK